MERYNHNPFLNTKKIILPSLESKKNSLCIYHLEREVLIILTESYNVKRESIIMKFLITYIKIFLKFEYIVHFQLFLYISSNYVRTEF